MFWSRQMLEIIPYLSEKPNHHKGYFETPGENKGVRKQSWVRETAIPAAKIFFCLWKSGKLVSQNWMDANVEVLCTHL